MIEWNALREESCYTYKMKLIGDKHYTPGEKAERIDWFYKMHAPRKDDTDVEKETKAYTRWVMMLLVNGNFQHCAGYEDIRGIPSRDEWKRATAIKQHGAFVTISLPNTHTVEPDKLYEKCLSCQGFRKFIFTAEFYSGVESNLNKHYHIFIYGKHHKANTIKLFSRFFKIGANFVDFIQTYDEETNSQKIKYIKGEKKKEKEQNVILDKEYRRDNGLKDFYEYNL